MPPNVSIVMLVLTGVGSPYVPSLICPFLISILFKCHRIWVGLYAVPIGRQICIVDCIPFHCTVLAIIIIYHDHVCLLKHVK